MSCARTGGDARGSSHVAIRRGVERFHFAAALDNFGLGLVAHGLLEDLGVPAVQQGTGQGRARLGQGKGQGCIRVQDQGGCKIGSKSRVQGAVQLGTSPLVDQL